MFFLLPLYPLFSLTSFLSIHSSPPLSFSYLPLFFFSPFPIVFSPLLEQDLKNVSTSTCPARSRMIFAVEMGQSGWMGRGRKIFGDKDDFSASPGDWGRNGRFGVFSLGGVQFLLVTAPRCPSFCSMREQGAKRPARGLAKPSWGGRAFIPRAFVFDGTVSRGGIAPPPRVQGIAFPRPTSESLGAVAVSLPKRPRPPPPQGRGRAQGFSGPHPYRVAFAGGQR